MAKLIHSIKSASFETAYPNWEKSSDLAYYAICFTDDGYLYTHGKKFAMSVIDGSSLDISLGLVNDQLTLTAKGYNPSIVTLPVAGIENDGIITTIKGKNSVWTIGHKTYLTDIVTGSTYGSSSDIDAIANIPSLLVDKYGHISSISNKEITLNHVKLTLDETTNKAFYLLGTESTTTEDSVTKFSKKMSFNPSTGTIDSYIYTVKGKDFSSYIVDANGSVKHADSTNYGLVKLSDTWLGSSNGASVGIAATPKALNDVYVKAKLLFATNDAMIYIGIVDLTGAITSSNVALTDLTKDLTKLTKYQAGWTFRYAKAAEGTNSLPWKLEDGDIIICNTDWTSGGFNKDHWTVIQANIDGAVTASDNLNGLVVGSNSRNVSSFNLNSEATNKYLKCNNGKLEWVSISDANTWRPIHINGSLQLNSGTDTGVLNFVDTTFIGVSYDNGIKITPQNLKTISFKNGASLLGSYNPTATDENSINSIITSNGLEASLANNAITIKHKTSTATALSALALKKIKTDSYGHIIEYSDPASLTVSCGNNSVVFNGNDAKTVSFANNGDFTFSSSISGSTLTIKPSVAHKYKSISYYTKDQTPKLITFSDANATDLIFKPGNNISYSHDGSNLTISAINSWRNVSAYMAASTTAETVLSTSVGTADLAFGNEFLWTSTKDSSTGEIKLMWAEVDGDGKITYTA